jgi:hypothetical protein
MVRVCKDADGRLADNEPGGRISGNSGFDSILVNPRKGVALTCRARLTKRRLQQAWHGEGTVRSLDLRMGRGFVISAQRHGRLRAPAASQPLPAEIAQPARLARTRH